MKKKFLRVLLTLLIPSIAASLLLTALRQLDDGRAEAGRKQLEEALRRSAVTCYAVEGVYPPTLDYLRDHYGIQIDESRYIVFYEVFAENLMPEITVLLKES